MSESSFDGDESVVSGKSGDDTLRADYGNESGTIIDGNAGNDTLLGGNHDDILIGGSGNDQMWGGLGGDQFKFWGDEIDGGSDVDRIYDLKFQEGDWLVFGDWGAGMFADGDGINAYSSGASANIETYQGLVNAVNGSDRFYAIKRGATDTLVLALENESGQIQYIHISNGWSLFAAAGGTTDWNGTDWNTLG